MLKCHCFVRRYIGSSVCFESVEDVVKYNSQLLANFKIETRTSTETKPAAPEETNAKANANANANANADANVDGNTTEK